MTVPSSEGTSASQGPAPATSNRQDPPAFSSWRALAHLLLLSGLAVAQPIYDVLGRGAEFFVAHDAQGSDFAVLLAVLSLLPGCLLAIPVAAVARFSRRWARTLLGIFVALLSALVILPILVSPLASLDGRLVVAIAAALGCLVAWAYQRWQGLTSFFDLLTPAVVIFPLLFVFASPVKTLIFPPSSSASTDDVRIADPKPVFLLVFDELPIGSLLNGEEEIDGARFPHFAQFASEAQWFLNATTPASDTTYAVPGMLTGRYPSEERLPTAQNYPETLFQVFSAAGYHLEVYESHTRICPVEICTGQPPPPPQPERLRGMFSDIAVIYLHRVLPEDLKGGLPAVSGSWKGFGDSGAVEEPTDAAPTAGKQALTRPISQRESKVLVADTLEALGRAPQASLFFLHLNLPHVPWKYAPSGREYGPAGLPLLPHGLVGNDWGDDLWQIQQAWQRHLLQVQYCDRILGELRQRMIEVGLWDDAFVAVVADHGISFRPGQPRRAVNETIVAEIANVPLLVKLPGNDVGRVVEAPVETVDLLPTLAQVLDFDVPWTMDGTSLLATTPRSDERLLYRTNKRKIDTPLRFDSETIRRERRREVARRIEVFAGSNGDLYRLGPGRQHIGSAVADLPSHSGGSGWDVELDQPWQYEEVDLDSTFLPSHITGRLMHDGEESAADLQLMVAVNGVLRAGTRPFVGDDGQWRFTAMVAEEAFRPGKQDIAVFEIAAGDTLRRLNDRQSLQYELVDSPAGETLVIGDRSLPIDRPLAGEWRLIKVPLGRRVSGWVAEAKTGRGVEHVVLFVDGRFIALAAADQRPENGQAAADPRFADKGFSIRLPDDLLDETRRVRLFGVVDGRAGELMRRGQ